VNLQFDVADLGETPEADEFIKKRGYSYNDEVSFEVFLMQVSNEFNQWTGFCEWVRLVDWKAQAHKQTPISSISQTIGGQT
jgi:hypothetical protein